MSNREMRSLKGMKELAENFLKNIFKEKNNQAKVICLYGNLGAGKTTLVQFFGEFLGIKEKIVSPTFVIMKKYKIKHENYNQVIHIDAYRLDDKTELEKDLKILGWEEIISNPKNLVFIEWPEMIKKYLPKNHHKIKIYHTKGEERGFEFN